MPGSRTSLRSLIAAVPASAVACAYLAAAARLDARATGGMTLAALALAAAAALAERGRPRAFAAGFAAAGWAYLAAWNAGRPAALATGRWIEAAYARIQGFPASMAPHEVAGVLRELASFLAVGHHLLTMLLATLGGLLALAVAASARRAPSGRDGGPAALPGA